MNKKNSRPAYRIYLQQKCQSDTYSSKIRKGIKKKKCYSFASPIPSALIPNIASDSGRHGES